MVSVLPALPPLLLLPLSPLESSPPHAATPSASAATRQPEAAMNFDFKEPLLMRLVFRRRFYARPDHACNTVVRAPDKEAGPRGAYCSLSATLIFAAGEVAADDVERRRQQHEQHPDQERVEGLDQAR